MWLIAKEAGIPTIELHCPIPDILQEGAAAGLSKDMALLDSFVQVALEHVVQWRRNDRENNGPAANAPTPANLIEELIGNLGANKGGNNIGRRGESERQTSVLQGRGIGRNDIDGILHSTEAKLIEDLHR